MPPLSRIILLFCMDSMFKIELHRNAGGATFVNARRAECRCKKLGELLRYVVITLKNFAFPLEGSCALLLN